MAAVGARRLEAGARAAACRTAAEARPAAEARAAAAEAGGGGEGGGEDGGGEGGCGGGSASGAWQASSVSCPHDTREGAPLVARMQSPGTATQMTCNPVGAPSATDCAFAACSSSIMKRIAAAARGMGHDSDILRGGQSHTYGEAPKLNPTCISRSLQSSSSALAWRDFFFTGSTSKRTSKRRTASCPRPQWGLPAPPPSSADGPLHPSCNHVVPAFAIVGSLVM